MTVTTSTIDETIVVTIDRPPVNALDLNTILALEQAFSTIAREDRKNGVVLTGGGQVFSAGVDTRAFASYGREQRHNSNILNALVKNRFCHLQDQRRSRRRRGRASNSASVGKLLGIPAVCAAGQGPQRADPCLPTKALGRCHGCG
jgi:enoyl-CoA hydratase/carnithine racemase